MAAEMESLRTASLYINNQLLSRGLLRDGHSIDFANPCGDGGDGLPAAMGRIMSVVNDLILKRDRDAEHRESLASTLRTLRAETLRQTTDHTRQASQLADTQRKLDSAEATERAVRTQLRTAEANIHRMKDEMHKMKTLVAQTRSSCANEVRKRDRQIEALKKTVTEAARVRGGARSRDVVTISVTGDFGSEGAQGSVGAGATADAEYSLRMETNEFLTRLARGLSEENEGLVGIVRQTVDSLREMSGLEAELVGASGSSSDSKGAEELASELETIMAHLRNILTNPSFVPIEELEARDEEIARLRSGFEKMETRWRDAVRMIDGWRRRMGSGGRSVDMEELSMGLRLSPVRLRDVMVETDDISEQERERVAAMELSCVQEEDEEEEEQQQPIPAHRLSPTKRAHKVTRQPLPPQQLRTRSPTPVEALELVAAVTSQDEPVEAVPYDEEEDDSDASSIYDVDEDLLDLEEDDGAEEPNFEVLQVSTATNASSPPLPERPQLSPLKDSFSAGNKQPSEERQQQPSRKRAGDFSAALPDEQHSKKAPEDSKKREKREPVAPSTRTTRLSARRSLEKSVDSFEVAYESPHFGKSSEKAASELRLFSKPAAPALLPSEKARTATATTRAKPAEPPVQQKNVRKAIPSRTAAVVEDEEEKQREGPAEKKLRRSLPESEPETEASPEAVAPPLPATTRTQPAAPAPAATSSRSNKALQPAKAEAALPAKASPAATQQQHQNRSPIRPQGGTRLLPPRRKMPVVPQSPLTMEAITAKLAASEREADAARVRAKLKAARLGRRGGTAAAEPAAVSRPASPAKSQESPRQSAAQSPINITEPTQDDNEADAALASVVPEDRDMLDELTEPEQHNKIEVVKRKRDRRLSQATNRRASRRRSTLSPWELESLITGNVGPASPTR
ncbi:Afadin and alpha-actinin-binding-domain-containing protein [Microdochium bolleyi]|uniref:Afadin and alpha-actinin-binding-domain-containing protein n=1 Tax=Microdochium bolleyi TaxID=196109 RepID=A0A136J1P3_9PEZI|nr:Afadin and alpha-actinin-binding-domain-containing protein [Microdochium bolleyi]